MNKNISILGVLVFAIALMSYSFTTINGGETKTVDVDLENSTVTWKAYKVTGEHAGTVQLKSGALQYEEDKLVGGSFEIDMTSIKVTDLQGEWAGKLEGHLKSPDFFGVEKHPSAKLEITRVISRGTPGDYKVLANLTIKENTNPIKFFANIAEKEGKTVAIADITVDRSEYDVQYGSGSFFDDLGDKTIYDEFDLSVSLVLK